MSVAVFPAAAASGPDKGKVIYPSLGADFPMEASTTPTNVTLKADDGMDLEMYDSAEATTLEQLPTEADLAAKVRALIDMLERLADVIRDRVFWRPRIAEEARPAGSVEGGGFTVVPDMMSLVGCSGEDFLGILRSLEPGCIAGRMGGDRVKVKSLKVLKIFPEKNYILISGNIPGHNGSIVYIQK